MEFTKCNLCGKDELALFREIPDRKYGSKDHTFTIMGCNACGLLFLNPRPSRVEIGRYYPEDYYDQFPPYYNPDSTTHRLKRLYRKCLDVFKHRQLKEKRKRVERYGPEKGRILDIGCANGDYLNYMKSAGWEVAGVEISKAMCEYARCRYDINVFNGMLEQAAFESDSFDAVTMWSSLEHTHDPNAIIKEIYRMLKKGGVGIFLVPNIESFEAKLFGDRWGHLDAPRHMYHFSPKTLTKMLTQNGFQVLDLSYFTSLIDSTLRVRLQELLTLSCKGKRSLRYVATASWNASVRAISYLVGYGFYFIPAVLSKGHTMIVSARKPGGFNHK